jgi:hypothetical protein
VDNVRGTMTSILDFCKLEVSNKYLKLLPKRMKNMNYKWKTNLTPRQKIIINKSLGGFMRRLGYNDETEGNI